MEKTWKCLFVLNVVSYSLHSLPSNPEVVAGKVNVQTTAKTCTVDSSSNRSIIEWGDFSCKEGEMIFMNQLGATSAILNRVTGGDISHLNGLLQSNGEVFLINPNGIVIGKNGLINVAGFIASTLDLANRDFLEGSSLNFCDKDSIAGAVKNFGVIYGNESFVYLLGSEIENAGIVEALSGHVGIGSGKEILVKPLDREFTILSRAEIKDKDMGIIQSGDISAEEIDLKVDGNLYELAMNITGSMEASTVHKEGGRILLLAEKGKIFCREHARMQAQKENGQGGEVCITGEEIQLLDSTFISTRSEKGNGRIYVGGGMGGNDPEILNAEKIFIDEPVKIDASAKIKGDGGEVSLFANDNTVFLGRIFARGGSLAGDGGKVEVSGKNNLSLSGLVNTTSPRGKTGLLTIDPNNITIGAGTADLTCPTFSGGAGTRNILHSPGANSLQGCLAANNVLITTTPGTGGSGDVTFDTTFLYTTPGNNLTINADRDINVTVGITFRDTTGQTSVFTFLAGRNIDINSGDALNFAEAASVSLIAGNSVAGGSINFNGDFSTTDVPSVSLNASSATSDIFLPSTGTVSILGSTLSSAATLFAGQDIIIQDTFVNTGTGSFSATAGRDFRVGGGSDDAQFGVRLGDVMITCDRDLSVTSGLGGSDSAIIGMDEAGLPTISNITFTVGRDVILDASAAGSASPALIGHGQEDVIGGDKTGNITFTSIGGNMTLTGGGAGDSWAQIGHVRGDLSGALTIEGNIQGSGTNNVVDIPRNLIATAGTGAQSYALVGHGGREEPTSDTFTGIIGVKANTIRIIGAASTDLDNVAAIGYYVAVDGAGAVTITSTSEVRSESVNISILESNRQGAHIGARVRAEDTATGSITLNLIDVTSGLDLNILGSVPHSSPDTVFVGAFTNVGDAQSNVSVTVANDLLMSTGNGGGTTAGVFTQITNGLGSVDGFTETVNVTGDAFLLAGNGFANIQAIDTLSMTVGGDLILRASNNADAAILSADTTTVSVGGELSITSFSTTNQGQIQNTAGNLTVSAGDIFMTDPGAEIETLGGGNTTVTTTLTGMEIMEAAQILSSGVLTVSSAQDIDISAGVVGGSAIIGSGTTTTVTAVRDITLLGPKEASIQATTGDLSVTAGGTVNILLNTFIENLGASTGSLSVTAADLSLINGGHIENFGTGIVTITTTNDARLFAGSFIQAFGTLTASIGRDLDFDSTTTGGAFIRSFLGGSITAGRDISLTGPLSALIENFTSGNLTVIAGRNVTVDNGGMIVNQGPGSLTIVVDNDFPSPPLIGPGSFTLEDLGSVGRTLGGPLRIFTAVRSQNDIDGTINLNGTTFTPGPFDVDSATEIWSTYFPSALGGTPFTIFYKEPQVIPPSPIPSPFIFVGVDMTNGPFPAANFELFYLLDQYYPYRPWLWRTCVFESASKAADAVIRMPYVQALGTRYCWILPKRKFL